MRAIIAITILFTIMFVSCSKTNGIAGSYGVIYANSEHDTLQLEIFPDSFVVFSHQSDGFCGEYHVGLYVLKMDSNNYFTLVPSSITNNNIPLNVTKKKKETDSTVLLFEKLCPLFQWKLILSDTILVVPDKKMVLKKKYSNVSLMGVFKNNNRFVYDTILTKKIQIEDGYEYIVTIDNRYYSSIHYMGSHKEGIIFNRRHKGIETTMSRHKMKRLRQKYFNWEAITGNH